jgi:hypothetical protein
MRLSEFRSLMNDEFGEAYAGVIERDLVLPELGDKTAAVALAAGEEPKEIWLAICKAQEVPKSRWHGKPKSSKKVP